MVHVVQLLKAEAAGRKISYAEAHEEVIADSMETMLTDGKAIEKLQMLQTKDPSLFEKIKSAIAELIVKIKKAYKNVKPETLEGQIVASMLDEIETIQQLFADAIADASENFKSAEANSSENVKQSDIRYSQREKSLEKDDTSWYDKHNPLSFDNRAGINPRSSINWVYKAEIFSQVENKLFNQMVSEINQGSKAFEKNSAGEYILPIENKIVFTDGNYDYPYIREIIEVMTDTATEFEDAKERIFNVEKGKSSKQESACFLQNFYGDGFIVSYRNGVVGVYAWENGKRKGRTRREVIGNYQRKQNGRGNDKESNETSLKLSDRNYSYDALVSKPDMKVTTLYDFDQHDRKDVVKEAKKNATSVGKANSDGSVSVYVDDIDGEVIVSTKAIRHSLDSRSKVNIPVGLKIGEILKNSIKINELNPREENISQSYVLMGMAKNTNNEPYVVSFVVNSYTNTIDTVDVLYSANAKKTSRDYLPEGFYALYWFCH